MEQRNKPNWWLVVLTVPLMIGLLLLQSRLQAAPEVHRIMEFGIVVVGFGLMAMWVSANEGALENEEMDLERWVLVSKSEDRSEAEKTKSLCDAPSDPIHASQTSDTTPGTATEPESVSRLDDAEDPPGPRHPRDVCPNKGRYN